MTNKRGNGEGSVRQKSDGRWEARYTSADGKRHSLMGKTRAEASTRLAEAIRDRDKGLNPHLGDARQTVEHWLWAWHETMRPPRLRESTWINNVWLIRHITRHVGRVRLSQLTRAHVQQLHAALLANGLATSTVSQIHKVLRQALREAMRNDMIVRNIAELVTPPPVKKREMQVILAEQIDKLLELAEGTQLAATIAVTAATGMRAGEVLALKWARVDLERGVLHVKDNRTRTASGYTDGMPKTKSSERTIRLVSVAIDALRVHRAHQNAQRLAMGEAWLDQDRVFPAATGKAMHESTLVRQWHRLLLRAGIAGAMETTFHDLRHSAASWLLAQGVPIVDVSKLLGHADASITLRIYAHALPDSQEKVVAAMEFLLQRKPTQQDSRQAEKDA